MAGFSNYLRNKIHDWLHRGQAFSPPAIQYVALCTSQPSASTAGTEVSSAGYARQPINMSLTDVSGTQADGSTAVSSGTSGEVSNNLLIDYGTADTAWGVPNPVGWWETYDALTGGNRLEFGTITDVNGASSPKAIAAGDPVAFPVSALRFKMT